jgi:hypothetical protein
MASGIIQWLYAWWGNPYSIGFCHHRFADQNYSGPKNTMSQKNGKGET